MKVLVVPVAKIGDPSVERATFIVPLPLPESSKTAINGVVVQGDFGPLRVGDLPEVNYAHALRDSLCPFVSVAVTPNGCILWASYFGQYFETAIGVEGV